MNWEKYFNNSNVFYFQDPITDKFNTKEKFYKKYNLVLDNMNGKYIDTNIEYYYKETSKKGVFKFISNKTKNDFIKACKDFNIINNIEDTPEEEKINKEKEKMLLEIECKKLELKLGNTNNLSKGRKSLKNNEKLSKLYNKLKNKIEKLDINDSYRIQLEIKIESIVQMMENTI